MDSHGSLPQINASTAAPILITVRLSSGKDLKMTLATSDHFAVIGTKLKKDGVIALDANVKYVHFGKMYDGKRCISESTVVEGSVLQVLVLEKTN